MEFFGWFCLLMLAIGTSISLVAALIVDYAFTGRKFSLGYALSMTLPLSIPAMLWYGVVVYSPFVLR